MDADGVVEVTAMRARSPVYVAHPMVGYGTPHAAACLDELAGLLPGARLLDPATIFASDSEWQRSWPWLVRALRGVRDVRNRGWHHWGGMYPGVGRCHRSRGPGSRVRRLTRVAGYNGLDLIVPGSRSGRRTATLRLGRCVERPHGSGESSGSHLMKRDDLSRYGRRRATQNRRTGAVR